MDACCERRPGEQAPACGMAVGIHLSHLFTVEEIVKTLHRYKLMPAISLCNILQHLELPCGHLFQLVSLVVSVYQGFGFCRYIHRTGANVSNFTSLGNTIECLHGLFLWHITIHPVDLQHVDEGAKAPNAAVYCFKNVLPGQSDLIDT